MDRLQLHDLLIEIQGNDAVYFQPPPEWQIQYPCIIYHVDNANTRFANNYPYKYNERYQVTVIDKDPDTAVRFRLAALPMTIFNRWYPAKNLNHYVYNLYA